MRIALVGYGKMGRGIFGLLSEAPLEVVVLDVDPEEMDRQNRRLAKRLARAASTGTLSEGYAGRRLSQLRFTSCWGDLRGCDLVIEAVFEDFDTKVEVLRQIEATVSPQAIITSNTSSFSLNKLAETLENPGRFSGFHFFHPIQLTTIVEIIAAAETSPETVDCLRRVARDINRRPLVVRDEGGGSCINVVLSCHSCEALYLLEQGLALPSKIDSLCGRFARIGPCEGLDVVGLPFFTDVLQRTFQAFPLGWAVPELCYKLVRDGRAGKYVGRGIYAYQDDRPLDDAAKYYLNPGQSHTPADVRRDDAALAERLLFSIYYAVLRIRQLELAELGDLCFGIQDLIGMKIDPLEEMQKRGSAGMREPFGRLQAELGSRFDAGRIEDALAELDRKS